MATTIDKYSVQLSADARKLEADLKDGGKDVDRFKADVDKKMEGGSSGGAHKFISGLRKDFKGTAKDIAFVGMAADHLVEAVGGVDTSLGKVVSAGKDIALAFAIGGPILGGFVAIKETSTFLAENLDKMAGFSRGKAFMAGFDEFRKTGDLLASLDAFGKSARSESKHVPSSEFVAKTNAELAKMTQEMRTQAALQGLSPAEKFNAQIDEKMKDNPLGPAFGEDAKKAFKELQAAQTEAGGVDFAKNLREQAQWMGKTAEQTAICKMALQGLSQEGIRNAQDALKEFEWAKLNQEVNDFTKGITQQADAYGLSSERAKLFAAAQKGADIKDAAKALARFELLNNKPERLGPNTALAAGSAAGLAAINQAQRDRDADKTDPNSPTAIAQQQTEILKDIAEKLQKANEINGETVDLPGT